MGHRLRASAERATRGAEQLAQLVDVGRLDQVVIEAGRARASLIVLPGPSRSARSAGRPRAAAGADASGHFVAVHLGHADVEQHGVGIEGRRARPAPRGRCAPPRPWPRAPSAACRRVSAASRLSSTTSTRRGGTCPRASTRRSRRASARPASTAARRRTRCPCRGRRCRASTLPPCMLDQAAHQRQPDAEAALRAAARAIDLREHVEDRRQRAPAGCRCRCRAPRPTACRRSSRATVSQMLPAGVRCTWRRWSAGWRTPASGGPRRPTTVIGCVGQVDASVVCRPRLDRRPARVDRGAHDRTPGRPARGGASISPRVMRDTSSRSSTSRTRCRICRSITAHARLAWHRRGAGMLEQLRGRCSSGASGLRSSWPSVARNSSLRRSACRSDSSARARSARWPRIWYCRSRARERGAHGADQRRHPQRTLEQRDVAERAHALRSTPPSRRPAGSAPAPAGRTRAAARRGRRRGAGHRRGRQSFLGDQHGRRRPRASSRASCVETRARRGRRCPPGASSDRRGGGVLAASARAAARGRPAAAAVACS